MIKITYEEPLWLLDQSEGTSGEDDYFFINVNDADQIAATCSPLFKQVVTELEKIAYTVPGDSADISDIIKHIKWMKQLAQAALDAVAKMEEAQDEICNIC